MKPGDEHTTKPRSKKTSLYKIVDNKCDIQIRLTATRNRKQRKAKYKIGDVGYSSDSINLVPVCDVRVDMEPPDCNEKWRSPGVCISSTEPVAYGSGDPLSARAADEDANDVAEDGESVSVV
jgi:hypothetical protein